MENVCYFLAIKFKVCQSGVPLVSQKVYTNVSTTTAIPIYNGYTLNVSGFPNDSINLTFNNTPLNLNFSFSVENGSTTIFDLPIDSGTLKVAILASSRCCALN